MSFFSFTVRMSADSGVDTHVVNGVSAIDNINFLRFVSFEMNAFS